MNLLKTADFFSLRGEFDPRKSRWNEKRRDNKAEALEGVIAKHVIAGVGIAVDMSAFRRLGLHKLEQRDGDPFLFCYYHLLRGMPCLLQHLGREHDQICMVYDFQRGGKANNRAKNLFQEDIAEAQKGWLRGITKASDEEDPGLQAADILAWRSRCKLMGKPHRPELFGKTGQVELMTYLLNDEELLRTMKIIKERQRALG